MMRENPPPGALQLPMGVYVATSLAAVLFFIAVIRRPLAATPPLQNGSVLLLLFVTALGMAYVCANAKSAVDWSVTAILVVFVGFFVRSLPNLLLSFPPDHDTYYYYSTLLNVVRFHTLASFQQQWYGDTARQLQWPMLQLLTTQVSGWSEAISSTLWRFFPIPGILHIRFHRPPGVLCVRQLEGGGTRGPARPVQ